MKIQIKNLRALKQAEFELGDMTIICGVNNTGKTYATYAALRYGPQMNNYRELIDSILAADEAKAEPLSDSKQRIIERIARTFPKDQLIYEAAHREEIWKEKAVGSLIPYTDVLRPAGL